MGSALFRLLRVFRQCTRNNDGVTYNDAPSQLAFTRFSGYTTTCANFLDRFFANRILPYRLYSSLRTVGGSKFHRLVRLSFERSF